MSDMDTDPKPNRFHTFHAYKGSSIFKIRIGRWDSGITFDHGTWLIERQNLHWWGETYSSWQSEFGDQQFKSLNEAVFALDAKGWQLS